MEEQAKQIQDNIKKINEKKQGNAVATGVKKTLTDAEKKEAERRKQTMEELTATVVNLEIKLQQEKVSAMADGRRKALEEVEIEKEERLKAIDDEEKERKKKYASVARKCLKRKRKFS